MAEEEGVPQALNTIYLDMVATEMVTLGLLVEEGGHHGEIAVFVDGDLLGVVADPQAIKALLVEKKVSVGHVACHTIDADTHENLATGRPMPSQPIDLTRVVEGLREQPPSATNLAVGAALRAAAQRRIAEVLGQGNCPSAN